MTVAIYIYDPVRDKPRRSGRGGCQDSATGYAAVQAITWDVP